MHSLISQSLFISIFRMMLHSCRVHTFIQVHITTPLTELVSILAFSATDLVWIPQKVEFIFTEEHYTAQYLSLWSFHHLNITKILLKGILKNKTLHMCAYVYNNLLCMRAATVLARWQKQASWAGLFLYIYMLYFIPLFELRLNKVMAHQCF